MNRIIILLTFCLCLDIIVYSQDPHFSQFFSAPHFNNPALTGTQFGDWAIMGNVRQQWGNAFTPFNTQALAADIKLYVNQDENNSSYIAMGAALMNDQTMNGAFRSNYASGSIAYHKKLSHEHHIAAGFIGSYNQRRLDYSRLSFSSQFTGRGFDLAVATGETSLSDMKPFFSIGAGLLYTYKFNSGDMLLDIGAAAYDINRPIVSFLGANNQLNIRHVGYINLQSYSADDLLFYQVSGIFHWQARQNYFALGGAWGFKLTPQWEKMFLLGCWFREGDAIYPYVAYVINNFQFGLNYDVTISKQNLGPSNPRSLELSFVYTGFFPKFITGTVCGNKNKNVRFPDGRRIK